MTDHEIVLYDMVRNNSLYKKIWGSWAPIFFVSAEGCVALWASSRPFKHHMALQAPLGPYRLPRHHVEHANSA